MHVGNGLDRSIGHVHPHAVGLHSLTCEGDAVSYTHLSCHLSLLQGIRDEPRALLHAVPGLDLREMQPREFCCGSGGLWGLKHTDVYKRQVLGIARTFQNIRLFRRLSVLDNVMVSRYCRTRSGLVPIFRCV